MYNVGVPNEVQTYIRKVYDGGIKDTDGPSRAIFSLSAFPRVRVAPPSIPSSAASESFPVPEIADRRAGKRPGIVSRRRLIRQVLQE